MLFMYLSDVQGHDDLFQRSVTSTLSDPVDSALHLRHRTDTPKGKKNKNMQKVGNSNITEEGKPKGKKKNTRTYKTLGTVRCKTYFLVPGIQR